MKSNTMTCRVCGRTYECCRSVSPNNDGVFRWQRVACSPECGAEYLRRISESRGILRKEQPQEPMQELVKRSEKRQKAAVMKKKTEETEAV